VVVGARRLWVALRGLGDLVHDVVGGNGGFRTDGKCTGGFYAWARMISRDQVLGWPGTKVRRYDAREWRVD